MSICFVWAWKDWSWVRILDPMLSQWIQYGWSLRIWGWSQPHGFLCVIAASNVSALVLDVATVGCFLELQETRPELSWTITGCWAMSVCASTPVQVYPSCELDLSSPSTKDLILVAYIYRMTCCAVVKCALPRLQLNWLRYCMAYETSGWVAVAAYIMDPTAVRYGNFSICVFSLHCGAEILGQDNMWI